MYNLRVHLPLSVLSLSWSIVGFLLVAYIGFIAVIMSYAALTVEFSQSIKKDESIVAVLEAQYLASVVHITNTDYFAEGYAKPVVQTFVRAKSVTALR